MNIYCSKISVNVLLLVTNSMIYVFGYLRVIIKVERSVEECRLPVSSNINFLYILE